MTMRYRIESFGGVLALEDPPMLVHVDKDFMRELGCEESPLWETPDKGLLSAPLEVHFSVTNACSLGCKDCYMDSGKKDSGEMTGDEFRRGIDLLAEMGVFHIAMGGGEALERPDFFELASYARSSGIVPNLTTNGRLVTEEIAAKCAIFGQVNVSVDWAERHENGRGNSPTPDWQVKGVDLLKGAGVSVGLNCVVTRQNFDRLSDVIAYARNKELTDVELLRLKPTGRGKIDYFGRRLTLEQNREFFPAIKHLSLEHDFPVKIDCSFVPMFCWHRPDKTLMEQFSVYGCEAGNVLLGVRSDGRFAGCSFLSGQESILDLPRLWENSEHLANLRAWTSRAPEPCQACDYLDICKGGCRAVTAFVTGRSNTPDPECPFVEETREKGQDRK